MTWSSWWSRKSPIDLLAKVSAATAIFCEVAGARDLDVNFEEGHTETLARLSGRGRDEALRSRERSGDAAELPLPGGGGRLRVVQRSLSLC